MMQFTEEQKDALICALAILKPEIVTSPALTKAVEIALVALPAEPAGKFYAGPRGKVSIHPSEALPLGFNPFYIAPPVPVLKLPDEVLIHSEMDFVRKEKAKEFNRCIAEIKRLNANAPEEKQND